MAPISSLESGDPRSGQHDADESEKSQKLQSRNEHPADSSSVLNVTLRTGFVVDRSKSYPHKELGANSLLTVIEK